MVVDCASCDVGMGGVDNCPNGGEMPMNGEQETSRQIEELVAACKEGAEQGEAWAWRSRRAALQAYWAVRGIVMAEGLAILFVVLVAVFVAIEAG